jgi:hypothetical protein
MQPKAGIHSGLLTSAAKRILKPSGLFQKGRSRTWLADHVWWMAVVEFQPSSWSLGSYLNVGCMWLWNTKQHISFDVGDRVNGFSPFENEEQFGPVADKLAACALEKVDGYRRLFRSIHDVSNYYFENAPQGFWPCFDAAIAYALAGRAEASAQTLGACIDGTDDDPFWLKEARSDARSLIASAADAQQMRGIISDRVMKTRTLQRLPPITEINFDASVRH